MFLNRIIYGIEFFVRLVVEIIKAVIDTAMCCLKGEVDPVVVEIMPDLKRPVSLAILSKQLSLFNLLANFFQFCTAFLFFIISLKKSAILLAFILVVK